MDLLFLCCKFFVCSMDIAKEPFFDFLIFFDFCYFLVFLCSTSRLVEFWNVFRGFLRFDHKEMKNLFWSL
jgi:hypothetical protein